MSTAKVSPETPQNDWKRRSHGSRPPSANPLERVKKEPEIHYTEQEMETARWIHKYGKINKRECEVYVPTKDAKKQEKNGTPFCKCGKKKGNPNHTRFTQLDDSVQWNDNSTCVKPTDGFGQMQFLGFGQKLAQYIRVDHNQDMKSMLDLMTTQWNLEVPDLIISVTGGAKNFHMKPRLKEVFRRGLMKAAEATGAWIITGGMHAGVMKHVGEAVRDYTVAHGNKSKVVAMGISPWGAINNKECLISDPVDTPQLPGGLWPALYKTNQNQKRSSPLDPNHSHFILVDNGSQSMFGTEIEFRGKLETAISRYHSMFGKGRGESKVIPSVCVVLEGGPGTLKTVKTAIESGTPAVIVEGSGRAADILAYAYAHSGEEKIDVEDKMKRKITKTVSVTEDKVWEEVEKQIRKEFGERDLEKNKHMVRECLKRRDHITVFRLDGTYSAKDIDMAILQALLKTNRDKEIAQLNLALAWNRIDITESEIFTDDSKFEPGDLHDVMYEAILNNKPDFVKLFLENGVVLGEFLTIKRLLQLYNNIPHKEMLYELLRRQKGKKKSFGLLDVANLISTLMGDFYQPLYKREQRYIDSTPELNDENNYPGPFDEESLEGDKELWFEPISMKQPDTFSIRSQYSQYERDLNLDKLKTDFSEPARELFIWSIMMNRLDLAMIFWDEGQELGIAASLVAQKLLKGLHDQSSDSELKRDLESSVSNLKQLAVGVLSECYSIDEEKCHMMLVRELPLYGCSTIIELAVEADNKMFIAHAGCQSLFNRIWSGKMSDDNAEWKLWISIFLTPFIPFLIKYRTEERFSANKSKVIKDDRALQRRETGGLPLLDREGTVVAMGNGGPHEKVRPSNPKKEKKHKSDSSHKIPWYMKIIYFYNSPIITFRATQISLLIFLGLYSLVILTDFHKPFYYSYMITIKEWILIFWVLTLFMEEIRQIIIIEASSIRLKLANYFSDHWNRLDVITIALFVIGEILRFIDNEKCLEAARIILALTLMTFCFRLLHTFSVHKELGPKLVMIGRMMVDLLYFLLILLVFVIAYGLCIQAILYPNSELDFRLIKNILEKAYFQIYGELFLEEIEGEQTCTDDANLYNNGTLPRCPTEVGTWLVPIILGVYILITNVLMLNLLIAMFSYTFSAIQDNTDKHWAFQRYYLTKEFHDRPPLAPPLIFVSHVYMIARFCCSRCCVACQNMENAFRKQFEESEVRQIVLWESMNSDEYLRRTEAEEQEKIESQVKATNIRVDAIGKQVDEIMENSFLMQSAENVNTDVKLPPALEDRMDYLQQQLDRTSKAIDWIVDTLAGMGPKNPKPKLQSVEEIRKEAKNKRDSERKDMKKTLQDMLQKQLLLHQQSRQSSYPTYDKKETKYRADVPDEKVPFEVEFKDYSPTEYTDQHVHHIYRQLGQMDADVDLIVLSKEERLKAITNWNKKDPDFDQDRTTFVTNSKGELNYEVKDGLPINPCGRTGMCGRGALYRFGPNHAGDPIVTRWKRDASQNAVRENGKKVLEFISVERSDNKEWAIPGGFFKGLKTSVHQCLKAELIQEAFGGESPQDLQKLWDTAEEVYRGYADDPRNTDNSWIETIAVNYHDEEGTLTEKIQLQAGDGSEHVGWMTISSKEQLYGVHLALLYEVAQKRKAAF